MAEAPKIKPLRDSVVDRFASDGEVIERGPVSVAKELVENSLDAASTSINLTIKDGGFKLIQVCDDGHGIRLKDLPILCNRHTTSKLTAFEDLQRIKSLGFRGEALASITHVAHVTVTTITKGQPLGYRVSYRDGVMEREPKGCAMVKGTHIMVENLFYNMVARRKTLQNSSRDYKKIVDLVSRFAIHHNNVRFSCRKFGKNGAGTPDVHTVATTSRLDAIRSVYGVSVANNLIKIEASDNDPSTSLFEMDGYVSNANYAAKKITMVLFINDRLVEWSALKRAIEFVYAATLPKASKPFIYISIALPPENIDVNVHPTKREVTFLNQEVIIVKIQSVIESALGSSNEARTFQEQTAGQSSFSPNKRKEVNLSPTPTDSRSQKVPVHKLARTDSLDPTATLHSHMQVMPDGCLKKNVTLNAVRSSVGQKRKPEDSIELSSVEELLAEINNNCDRGMMNIVRHCTYIGMANDVFALVRHNTRLCHANVVNLSKELMCQQVLSLFGHLNAIQLSDPAPLKDLIIMALKEKDFDSEHNDGEEFKEKMVMAEIITEHLKEKAEMLEEYFSIHIDEHGNISRLPVLLDQYTPDMDRLPEFVLSLGKDVDWGDEKNCFRGVSAALGNFYAMHPPMLPNPSGEGLLFYKRKGFDRCAEENTCDSSESDVIDDKVEHELLSEAETKWAQRKWSIQHVLFPSMRHLFKPPVSMASNGTFFEITRLKKLNKNFGRC